MTQNWLGKLKNRDRGIQFIQHLENIVTLNIFNPRMVYNSHVYSNSNRNLLSMTQNWLGKLKNRDRGIQFIQHLENIVTLNIFNPRMVYNSHVYSNSNRNLLSMTQNWLGKLKNRDRGIQFIQH